MDIGRGVMITAGLITFALSTILILSGLLNEIDRIRWHDNRPVLEYLLAGCLCGLASVLFFYVIFL